MRHHAVATRLLDWTQALGVALHFALWPIIRDPTKKALTIKGSSKPEWCQPHVWLLNPYRLNSDKNSWNFDDMVAPRFLDDGDESYGDYLGDFSDPGMDIELPVAVLPEVLNDRLNAQRGVFTIHGDLHSPMELLLPTTTLQRVDLPQSALPAAIEFLEDAGLNESVLFPDFDALGRDLHRKYCL